MTIKEDITALSFSPCGTYIAIALGPVIQIWLTPTGKTYSPFTLLKKWKRHVGDILSLEWDENSEYILSTGEDLTIRVFWVKEKKDQDEWGVTLHGHKDTIIHAYWTKNGLVSISKDGAIFEWSQDHVEADRPNKKSRKEESEKVLQRKYKIEKRHFVNVHAKVTAVAYHPTLHFLTFTLSNGTFSIYDLHDFSLLHSISISQTLIDSVAWNQNGEWIAFASSHSGKLCVWEWKSESLVLKQSGTWNNTTCLAYNIDATILATGNEEGEVKVWNTQSGFCYVSFTEHTSSIRKVVFGRGQTIFSASLDGTVRAFDLIRYRNFRTYTTPKPVQFSALAIDESGEIIVAAGDDFQIFMWNVRTSALVSVLSGHTGPISELAFRDGQLLSSSWDGTVRIWPVFERDIEPVTLDHAGKEVLTCTFSPDAKSVISSTLDGILHIWNISTGSETRTIEVRKDLSGGRKSSDRITAENIHASRTATSLSFSPDGRTLLVAGQSKYLCLYDIATTQLVKKFVISRNRDFEGMFEHLNSKNMSSAGIPLDTIDMSRDSTLPGTTDKSLRTKAPEIQTFSVEIAKTGRAWAAATTEGVLLFSRDVDLHFDPFELEIEVTKETTLEAVSECEYLRALIYAMKLDDLKLFRYVLFSVHVSDIQLIVRDIPRTYLSRFTNLFSRVFQDSTALEFLFVWLEEYIKSHANIMKQDRVDVEASVISLLKICLKVRGDLEGMCEKNRYGLSYVHDKMVRARDMEE